MSSIAFFLYRHLVFPLVFAIFRLLYPLWSKKLQLIIDERREPVAFKQIWSRPILVHSSSGEVEYAKPILRKLRKLYPNNAIVLSYFSPSAIRLIQGLDVDDVVPLPFDSKKKVAAFLDQLNPSLVLLARTDVWPEFVTQCRQRQIPSILFSATRAKPFRGRFFARWLNRWRFNQLSLIAAVSKDDEKNFRALNISTPVVVTGDTRYDQVLFRLQEKREIPVKITNDGRAFGVLGSTWWDDDQIWIDSLTDSDLRQGFRWFWVPHEISLTKVQELSDQLKNSGFKVERLSETSTWRADILIVDRIGYLADIYTRASIAFVGGSFKQKVHSVMEPLAAGCPVIVGPYHENSREALDFKTLPIGNDLFAVNVCENSDQIRETLKNLAPQIGNPLLREQIQSFVSAKSKASDELIQLLLSRRYLRAANAKT